MFSDLFLFCIKNLSRKRSRNGMTILGIAIGVASVALISSIGEIGKYNINQELSSLGMGGVMISGNQKVAGGTLDERHLEAIRKSGAVDNAIPVVMDYTKSYMRELMLDTVVWGIDSGANQVISLEAIHGRLITRNDVQANRRVCVVDQNVAQAYYKRDNIVGKSLTLQFAGGNADFEIVGVVKSGGSLMQGLMGDFIPSFLYMPYTSLQVLAGKDDFDQIAVRVREGVDEDVAGSQLISLCNGVSGVSHAFKAENMQGQRDKFSRILDTIAVVLSVIAGVSLLVAGLNIMTVMMVSVQERTREIGVKKSIGASRVDILFEFLAEALILTFLGSLAGALSGIALVTGGCLLLGMPVRFDSMLILVCVGFALVIGVLFGVYPATLASRMNPVDALRYE